MSAPIPGIFRQAVVADAANIWQILQGAIERRKNDGSTQWQNGYPNPQRIALDIDSGVGFVLEEASEVIAYAAVLINDEPAYDGIEGAWLSQGDFVVVHRVAVAEKYLGKGWIKILFQHVEAYAILHKIFSVKVDTNYDNPAMLSILEKGGYTYCGQVYFNGSPRRAFEKLLGMEN